MNIRAAILGSSGGSALAAAVDCLRIAGHNPQLVVITDRECGMEHWSQKEGFETVRIPFSNRTDFSEQTLEAVRGRGLDKLLLFYTRMVAAPLIDECRVSNIHPSLLPAFPGMRGVEQALASGAKLLGATLHRVDAGLDTGPIVAQVACALPPKTSLERANRLSYMQKVWLTLMWFHQLESQSSAETGAQTLRATVDVGTPEELAESELPGHLGAAVTVSSMDIVDDALRCAYVAWVHGLEFDNDAFRTGVKATTKRISGAHA